MMRRSPRPPTPRTVLSVFRRRPARLPFFGASKDGNAWDASRSSRDQGYAGGADFMTGAARRYNENETEDVLRTPRKKGGRS